MSHVHPVKMTNDQLSPKSLTNMLFSTLKQYVRIFSMSETKIELHIIYRGILHNESTALVVTLINGIFVLYIYMLLIYMCAHYYLRGQTNTIGHTACIGIFNMSFKDISYW